MTGSKLTKEPWVNLPTGEYLAGWRRDDEIAYNQRLRQEEKYRFFQYIFDFLSDNGIAGDYLEFGCHRCRTFRMALSEARRHDLDGMRFFAFDSFAGLPAQSEDGGHKEWVAGAPMTSEAEFLSLVKEHGIYADRVETVKGFFAESLGPQSERHLTELGMKVALATVDCDYYDSAVAVFRFLDGFLQEGSAIYIDDWFAGYKGNPERGVACAFNEYRLQSKWRFVEHMTIGWWGKSFVAYPPGT